MRAAFAILFLLSCHSPSLRAESIELASGKIHRGTLVGHEGGFLKMAVLQEAGGDVELRFRQDQVARIDFEDQALVEAARDAYLRSDWPAARQYLSVVASSRQAYLSLLPDKDQELWIDYLDTLLRDGSPEHAYQLNKAALPRLSNPSSRQRALHLAIQSARAMGDATLAQHHAREWIEAGHPSQRYATAWVILAEAALAEGDPDQALAISLQPIVFASFKSPQALEEAYAIALRAAIALDQIHYAHVLYREAHERKVSLPADLEQTLTPAPPQTTGDGQPLLSFSRIEGRTPSQYKIIGYP